jgi:hypothetical protein
MKLALKIALAVTALFLRAPSSWVSAQDVLPVAPELQPLQGSWEGTEKGRETDGKCTLTVSGDTFHFVGAIKGEWYNATITIAPGPGPKQMQGLITDCPAPDLVGKTVMAIFRIVEGALTVAGHPPDVDDAPRDFEGDGHSRIFTFSKIEIQNAK